ncbi:MAG: hypothetical protein J5I98_04960, partial [Phaeodactylibacter sp.]|nr:hypothetical protein [Phaeodactylibacter sp.]
QCSGACRIRELRQLSSFLVTYSKQFYNERIRVKAAEQPRPEKEEQGARRMVATEKGLKNCLWSCVSAVREPNDGDELLNAG